MKTHQKRKTIGFISLLLLVGTIQGCKEQVITEKKLRPVKSMEIVSESMTTSRVFSGTAHASQEANLSFKVSGTVNKVNINVGDRVKRGDVIAQLDPDTFQVELEQAKADVAQANALRRSAESEYQRLRQLYANNNASRNELDNALADAESAKASYEAAMQSEKLAMLNLGYTQLKVDGSCNVASVAVEANENISTGQTIAEVSCGELWEIKIDVPESLIANFTAGIEGVAKFSSIPNEIFQGEVTEVGVGTGDRSTFPVTLSLNSAPSNIRSNLAAEVNFQFANNKGTGFYVPLGAIAKDEKSNFVYVIQSTDEPGTATLQKRNVTVGQLSERGFEITDGLREGERIIVAGLNNAFDGMRVRN